MKSICDFDDDRTDTVNFRQSRSSVVPIAQVIDVSTSPSTTGENRCGPNGHAFRNPTSRCVERRSQGGRASSTACSDRLAEGFDLRSAEDRGKYAVEAVKILYELKNPAQVEAYMDYISQKADIPKPVLTRQYAQGAEAEAKPIPKLELTRKSGRYYSAVRYILYALFAGEEGAEEVGLAQYLTDEEHKAIYVEYERIKSLREPNLDDLQALEENYAEVEEIFREGKRVTSEQAPKVFADCVASLEKEKSRREIARLTEQIDKEKDPVARDLLLAQYAELTAKNRK